MTGFGCNQNLNAPPKSITLEYWTVYDDVPTLTALAGQYQGLHPYITINIHKINPDEIYNKFTEGLAEDKGPDIISVSNRSLGGYLSKLSPMPANVDDVTVQTQKGQMGGETTIVNTQSKQMVTLDQLDRDYVKVVKKDASVGGKIYGLPLSLDVMALYYNKDLLDRAGIPQVPKNWDEFSADVKMLTKFDKVSSTILQAGAALGTGKNIPLSSDLLFVLFSQSNAAGGNTPFVDKNGHAAFNFSSNPYGDQDTPAAKVMGFYTDFANSAKDTYTWNDDMPNALDSFANNSLAFFFSYSYQYPILKARNQQLNFGVVPMLQLSDTNPMTSANYFLQTVALKSKHKNEAWAFVDYLTHSAATRKYLQATERPTAIRNLIADQKNDPTLAPFASELLTADSWYKGKDASAADAAIFEMFKEWLQPGHDDQIAEWHQAILNRAASKVNQTF